MDNNKNEIKSTIMNRIQMINNEMNKSSQQQQQHQQSKNNRRWSYANTRDANIQKRQPQQQQKSCRIVETLNETKEKGSTKIIDSDSLTTNNVNCDGKCFREISDEKIEKISSSSSSSSTSPLEDGNEIITKNPSTINDDNNDSPPAFYTITKPNFSFDTNSTTTNTTMNNNTNLRPILKHKDSFEKLLIGSKNHQQQQQDQQINLPPPILKKRDSIDGNIILSSTGNESSSGSNINNPNNSK